MGIILFAIVGLLPSSFIGGVIGLKVAGHCWYASRQRIIVENNCWY